MQRFKIIVPILLTAFAAMGLGLIKSPEIIRRNNPNNMPRYTNAVSETLGAAMTDDSALSVIATSGAMKYGGDSLIGCVVVFTSPDSLLNQTAYIYDVFDSADIGAAECSLFITPGLGTLADSGTYFNIFWSVGQQEIEAFTDTMRYFSGWAVNYGDTVYSEKILYDKSLYGDNYEFSVTTKIDTTTENVAVACSTNAKVWFEITHDLQNWYVPTGYSAIYANITDYDYNSKSVSLPYGTFYYRLCATGNVGGSATKGMNWLRVWINK